MSVKCRIRVEGNMYQVFPMFALVCWLNNQNMFLKKGKLKYLKHFNRNTFVSEKTLSVKFVYRNVNLEFDYTLVNQ